MQIWKRGQNGRTWIKRQSRNFTELKSLSLKSFIAQRFNVRKSREPIWVVFEDSEVETLTQIGQRLFVVGTEKIAFEPAVRTLEHVMRHLNYAHVDIVRIPAEKLVRKNDCEPSSTKVLLRLAVKINVIH